MDYRYDFSDSGKQNKKKIIFIILFSLFVLMFVALFFRSNKIKFVSSIANVISKPVVWIGTTVSNTYNNITVRMSDVNLILEENRVLEEENETLKMKVLESQRIIDENNMLKQMLNIKKEYQHFNVIMGGIIYREHDNWTQTFTINIGENDGVKIKQAVVHELGLVGYVSSVTENTAIVTTILDASSSVSVNISTINEPAVLTGNLELKSQNKLKLTYIPLDTEISESDMLYTSGISSLYPSSIPVGKIVEIFNSKNDVNRYAIVEPCVDISKISEVAVIIE